MENFKIEVDGDGIALVTFDVPGRSMNTLTGKVIAEIGEVVERIKTDAAIKGAVFASGKASGFCAGADLGELGGSAGAGGEDKRSAEEQLRAAFDGAFALNKAFRALETCGKPVATALEGLALGGGLEFALATHYRVAANNPKLQLGLPEAKVGLLPGAGGTQRLPRIMGAMNAAPYLLEGKSMTAQDALAKGVVGAVVEPGQTVAAAKEWVKTGDPVAPWDKKDFRLPGGGPYSPTGGQVFIMGNAMLRKTTFGNFPAQLNILKCLYEGLQVPIDAALRIETRYFLKTMQSPQARGMIRTLFLSMQELGKGSGRPAGVAPYDVKKVAVLGAGMMGAGIAYVQAQAGIETVLVDVSQESAEKGKGYARGLVEKAVKRGKLTAEKGEALLALIHPTADYADVKGSDLVVEAVFESRELKATVTKQAEAQLAEAAVFGSNTSTLPITGLAEASVRPANFIGIHFFSPVDKMGLVEIIMGKATSDETLAKSIDYVLKIRKTPIVVNDSRGFYTSRCFGTYIQEGLEMLAEGMAPAIIDNVGRATGMPRGPLELNDDVALDLAYKVREQTKKDLGEQYVGGPVDSLITRMVVDLQRFGRKNGKGFYDYPADGGAKTLWPGLKELVEVKTPDADKALIEEIRTRLLYRQAVEAARCFEENVLTDPRDGDVGAILGWGFAPWTGGPISLIDSVGTKAFVAKLDELTAKYGSRYAPGKLLREMAEKNETFYGRFGAKAKAAA